LVPLLVTLLTKPFFPSLGILFDENAPYYFPPKCPSGTSSLSSSSSLSSPSSASSHSSSLRSQGVCQYGGIYPDCLCWDREHWVAEGCPPIPSSSTGIVPNNDTSGNKLSGGSIAGITVGVVGVVVLLVAVMLGIFYRRRAASAVKRMLALEDRDLEREQRSELSF